MAVSPPDDLTPAPVGQTVLTARLCADYPDLPSYVIALAVSGASVAADALGAGQSEARLDRLARDRLDMIRRRVPAPSPSEPPEEAPEQRVNLSLTTDPEAECIVVRVGGEVDVHTAPRLREHLGELVRAGHQHLVLDLEAVEFLDSTGLGVLVSTLRRTRARRGSVHLVFTHERILKIFRLTGLDKVFPIHPSVAEAVAVDRRRAG